MIQSKTFIHSSFDNFRKSGQFIDCNLIASGEKYPAHRILLAQHSNWFRRYFEEHPCARGQVIDIQIPIDTGDRFTDFLDLLYNGKAVITHQNIPLLLKLTDFFEVTSLNTIMKKFCMLAVNDTTLLPLVKEFIRLDLIKDAMNLSGYMARKLKDALNGKKDKAFSIKKFYNAVSPKVLASVLNDEVLRSLSDSKKVKLIDNYVGDKELTDPSDCEALASCIDWKQENSKYHLVNNRCEWLPPEISFDLYKKLLMFRKGTVLKLKKSVKEIDDNKDISRWYLFSWASKIHDSTLLKDDNPECEVVSFIRTVGGMISPIDPHKYGLIQTFQTDNPVYTPKYQASNILNDDDSYFMAISKNLNSLIGIDLGKNARFSVLSASLKTHVDVKVYSNKIEAKKPVIKKIGVTCGENESQCKTSQNIITGETDDNNGEITIENQNKLPPSRCVAFKMLGKNSCGGNIIRVQNIEVKGCFNQ